MNKKIKEIKIRSKEQQAIDDLKALANANEDEEVYIEYGLNVKAKLLLDYITNLQEENKSLKANVKLLDDNRIYLNDKIDKAIEYIERLDKDYDINVYQEDKHWAMVLYILQGSDKE